MYTVTLACNIVVVFVFVIASTTATIDDGTCDIMEETKTNVYYFVPIRVIFQVF